jgi:hypothetical protein
MALIYIPDGAWELALVICLLDAYSIPWFVHNHYFGGLYPGCQFDLYNMRRVYVPSERASYARQLIEDFFPGLGTAQIEMSGPDKLRLVVEAFLGGWFVPGNKWPDNTGIGVTIWSKIGSVSLLAAIAGSIVGSIFFQGIGEIIILLGWATAAIGLVYYGIVRFKKRRDNGRLL